MTLQLPGPDGSPARPLYVRRDLDLGDAKLLHEWARRLGMANLLPPEEMHVTIVYSEAPVYLEPETWPASIWARGIRLEKFDRGAIVLRFDDSYELQAVDDDQKIDGPLTRRWNEAINRGASWKWPDYKPHITLAYDPEFSIPAALQMEDQLLNFGPEVHEAPKTEDDMSRVQFRIAAQVNKVDDEQRMVWGWASVVLEDGQLVVDKQDDIITVEDLQKAAWGFMEHRNGGDMHTTYGRQIGEVVESMVFTPELQKALGIDLKKVGWLIGVKIKDDSVWKKVKDGTYPAFSIGGTGERLAIDKAFDESKHPRAKDGKFTSGDGGSFTEQEWVDEEGSLHPTKVKELRSWLGSLMNANENKFGRGVISEISRLAGRKVDRDSAEGMIEQAGFKVKDGYITDED